MSLKLSVPCNAGQFKSKDSCKPCKNGMYQDIDVHAYEFCKFCRKGTTTIEYGSKSNDSCVGKFPFVNFGSRS